MRNGRRLALGLGVTVWLVAFAPVASAGAAVPETGGGGQSVTVTRFDDPEGMGNCPSDCSLREAMAYVGAGGTVDLPAGSYTLSEGELLDDVGVMIVGAGARTTTIAQDSPEPDHVLEIDDVAAEVEDVTITGGNAGGSDNDAGGGILLLGGGALDLVDSTVTGNRATAGGGIYESDGAEQVTVTGSTISDNTADQDGGGINDESGHELDVVDSTIADNTASGIGGGVMVGAADATLTNDTIVGNSAQDGAGIEMGEAAVHVVNTILAASNGPDCGDEGVDSDGHNIASDDTCDLTATADQPLTDPQLGPLQDNAGPTDTLLPGDSSPAIDAGDDGSCPAVDQRGVTRPQGPDCDIGSVEVAQSNSDLRATTGGAGDILRDSATVFGQVFPGGSQAIAYFEYGTSTEYASQTPDQDASGDDGYVAAAALNGLSPHTTYHYRLVAVEDGQTVSGADHQFTTLGPPLVTTGSATSVTGNTATLTGTINPQTSGTRYHFEYGTTPAYDTSVPTGHENALGATDQADHAVSIDLPADTLQSNTTYHYRLVAENQDGTTDGADQTFTTLPAPPTVDDESAVAGAQSVDLHATVEPHGLGGSYYFEWTVGCDRYALPDCQPPGESGSTEPASFSPGDSKVVVLRQSMPAIPGATIYVHVVLTTAAGTTTGPGTDVVIADATPPSVRLGPAGGNRNGTLSLTGDVSPDGYDVVYHFRVRLACNGAQSFDTPDQAIGGGNYGVVPVQAPVTVSSGTTISVQLVADYTTSAGSSSVESASEVVRSAGKSSGGNVVSVSQLQSTSADLGVFATASGTLAPRSPTPGEPLTVHVEYGPSAQYGSTTDDSTWTADGSAPACPFSGQFSLSGLSPNTVYHYRAVIGYLHSTGHGPHGGGSVNFVQLTATPDRVFRTPAGNASSTATASPGSGQGSQTVTCSTPAPCSGSVGWQTKVNTSTNQSDSDLVTTAASRRSRTLVLGTMRFRLPAHSRRTITVHLSRAGRRLLRGRRTLAVTEVLRIRSGHGRMVTTRHVIRVTVAKSRRRHKR